MGLLKPGVRCPQTNVAVGLVMDSSDFFSRSPIVPVVVIDDVQHALPLAEALLEAGIQTIEVTLRTEAAIDSIEQMVKHCPEMTVGAGSVRHADQILQAQSVGAEFCICPGYSETLFEQASKCEMRFVPGIASAAEAVKVLEWGYSFVKFFPAELLGGVKMISALSAPLPELRFFPTGGITEQLASNYLSQDAVVCLGGTWFVKPEKIASGDFDWITQRAREAVGLYK